MKIRSIVVLSALLLAACGTQTSIKISNASIPHEGFLKAKFTCDGAGFNPLLNIKDIPEGTQSLALVIDDPDAPSGDFTHWVVYGIDPSLKKFPKAQVPRGGIVGLNSAGNAGYIAPCPPQGSGVHNYHFKIYAVSSAPKFDEPPSKTSLMDAIERDIIGYGELIGKYERLDSFNLVFCYTSSVNFPQFSYGKTIYNFYSSTHNCRLGCCRSRLGLVRL